jgi:hypothetical protein
VIKLPVKVEPMVGNDRQPPWEIHDADGSDIALCYTMGKAEEIAKRINAHDTLVAALKYIEEWTHVDPAKSSAPEDAYTDALAEIRKVAERAVRVPETLAYLLSAAKGGA